MINIGDYVTTTECVPGNIKITGNTCKVICRLISKDNPNNCKYYVINHQHISGWTLKENFISYLRKSIESNYGTDYIDIIDGVERFVGLDTFWYSDHELKLLDKVKVYLPDNSIVEMFLSPALGLEINPYYEDAFGCSVCNSVAEIVEISGDGKTVYTEWIST